MYRVLLLLIVAMVTVGKELGEDTPIAPNAVEWLNSLFYLPTETRVRREYRTLSESERHDFHRAFQLMKNDTSLTPNKYDVLSSLHTRRSTRNSAHRGPGFLGWHRVYLIMFENALREKVPHVTIPYWDSTMDARLKLPRQSSIWTEEFMGNGDGHVTTGPFAKWKTQRGFLYRTVGKNGRLLAEQNVTRLMLFDHIGEISYPRYANKTNADILELNHNAAHRYIGGDMTIVETAAEDPVFFVFHSFVNLVWENFRGHQRSKGIDPETDWDVNYGKARHHKYSPMGLGNLFAIDGSSEVFAENIVYADPPSCSQEMPDCGTPYLYCRVSVEQCFPWTTREYNEIRQSAEAKGVSFMEESLIFILEKANSTGEKYDEEAMDKEESKELTDDHEEEDHSHHDHSLIAIGEKYIDNEQNEETETTHEETETTHNPIEHTHVSVDHTEEIVTHTIIQDTHSHDGHDHHDEKGIFEAVDANLALIILGCSVLVFAIICLVSKCVADKRGCGSACCRKDAGVDIPYGIEAIDGSNTDGKGTPRAPRVDNIYTVTVTSNDGHDDEGTFVRFAKFESTGSGLVLDDYKLEKPSGVDPKDNYLDMSYATRSMSTTPPDERILFEKITEEEEWDMDDIEMESSCNSIDNENFDLEGIQAAYLYSKEVEEVVDEYDNVAFRQEQTLNNQPSTDAEPGIERGNVVIIDETTESSDEPGTKARKFDREADLQDDAQAGLKPDSEADVQACRDGEVDVDGNDVCPPRAPPTPPPPLCTGPISSSESCDSSPSTCRPSPRARRAKMGVGQRE